MLDAFIIDQLQRERERSQWEPIPLHLPVPTEPQPEDAEQDEVDDGEAGDRGVVIIENDGRMARL